MTFTEQSEKCRVSECRVVRLCDEVQEAKGLPD